ncbi:cysteine hydrolase family protein [Fictibacillus gelatini]|uniref:cysteine hydrolase family protein n=1 Tax=Fictibacillus gelatini TaxID=225985 RepID=UPI000685F761|nr:isochorismatase family cysteine hydrolase [Fictibacillus gelatini]
MTKYRWGRIRVKALIVIDYTNDFVANDGKLTCGAVGQSIEKRMVEITREFIQNGEFVVLAVDVHEEGDPYHPETNLFPPHNIRGTKGREMYGDLGCLLEGLNESERSKVYWMDKTRYSAFAGTDLELVLRERNVSEVHLIGVCTDICVLHTAVDAYNKGFKLFIHEDAVQSFNPIGHEWALQHFQTALGATILLNNSPKLQSFNDA